VYDATNTLKEHAITHRQDQWMRFSYMLDTLDADQSIIGKFSCVTSGRYDMFDLINTTNRNDDRSRRILTETVAYTAGDLLMTLTVVLATKNVIKKEVVNKLARLGIGLKKNPYHKTTTLTIGKVTEKADGKGGHDGSHRRPHLRRGHKRDQRYGPNWQYTRQIFIEPVFVNADEGWIAERTAYNVGKKRRP
jgi:hypothetical protein